MKLTWSKKRPVAAISHYSNLPFEQEAVEQPRKEDRDEKLAPKPGKQPVEDASGLDSEKLSESFLTQGNKLAEGGKYREALGKWETGLNLMPENAVLHEQKAQVLLEIGEAWSALKAATRATELEPSWAEAWVTLGRAQLNFGEPDSAIESFDKALVIKPDLKNAQDDRKTASQLVKRRKQLHVSGSISNESRYMVGEKSKLPEGT